MYVYNDMIYPFENVQVGSCAAYKQYTKLKTCLGTNTVAFLVATKETFFFVTNSAAKS